ncbi:MAG: hypothetical protein MRY57_03770 [Candidatus Pacebacteria bacterium]|nr:hypothetical protein [Candidatus Paceibacterota bacterium]
MRHLYINDLKNTLAIWEYANLFAEVIYQKMNKSLGANMLSLLGEEYKSTPMIGSEIDENGFLARGFRHYEKLKRDIEEDYPFNPNNFIPRIPKDLSSTVEERYSYVRSNHLLSIYRLPLILDGWLETRKVFLFENLRMLPIIRPNKKSYLEYLPYDSFIIKFNEPFDIFVELSDRDYSFPVSTIMVSSDDNFIDFIIIPYSVEGLLPDKNQIKKMKKIIRNPKKPSPNLLMELAVSQQTPCGFEFMGYSINRNNLKIHSYEDGKFVEEEYFEKAEAVFEDNSTSLITTAKEVLSIINGVCKLISEIPAQEHVDQINDKAQSEGQDSFEDFEWYKVPITEVKYLDNNGKFLQYESKYIVSTGSGSEKAYHKRRGHWKTIKKTGKRYWVNATEVNPHKKEDGPLKGSAIEIMSEK